MFAVSYNSRNNIGAGMYISHSHRDPLGVIFFIIYNGLFRLNNFFGLSYAIRSMLLELEGIF